MFYSQQHCIHPPSSLSVLISTLPLQLKIHLAVLSSVYTTQKGFYSLVSPWSGMSLGISEPLKRDDSVIKRREKKHAGGRATLCNGGSEKKICFCFSIWFLSDGQSLLKIWNFISWPSLTSHIKDRIWTSQQNLNLSWTFPNISLLPSFLSAAVFKTQFFLVSFYNNQRFGIWYRVVF